MVKAKKVASKKSKQDETSSDAEVPVEDSVAVDGKAEDNPEKATQENGDDSSLKKKSKGKTTKKEDTEDSAMEEETNQENGAEDPGTKKKPATKKAAKPQKPQVEPARKSSRTPKPVTKEGTEEQTYEVEKIIDMQLQRGKPLYLVRWKGYTKAEDTWENESSLNCPELLQKYKEEPSNKSKKRSSSKSPTKSAKKQKKEKEEDYEVEEIVGLRVKNGKKEFKIRWKGYKASDDSWEPEKHLSCQDLISKYLEQHKDDIQEEKKPTKKTPLKSKKTKKTKAK